MELNPAVLLVEPVAFAAGLAVLRVPIDAVRRHRLAVLGALAVVTAVGAAATGASPTGWAALDATLVAGLGAAAVLAGAHAPSPVILVGGLVAAAAGVDSVALPLALAAVGFVLVSIVVEAEPLVDAAAAGLVAQAALRLTSPGGRGLTALVAACVLVPLLVSAAHTLDPPHRRLLRRAAVAAAGLAVVGAVGGAVAAATAFAPLRRGLSAAAAAVQAPSAVDDEATAAQLADAAQDFAAARAALGAWWALPARAVPVVAQHWRVLHAAAVTGDELASAGRRALLARALGDVQVTDGRVPLDQVAAIGAPVADVADRASAARRRLDGARSAFLLPPVTDTLELHLGRMREIEKTTALAHRVVGMLPRLLGQDGPRRYFLAVQTPVEGRAGGGFLGNYGEITAEDGRLRLTRFGRQDDLTHAPGRAERTLQGPQDYLTRYQRFGPAQHWGNVNLSPDFPTNAAVMADLYPQSGGAPIDGVIAVDPAGLAALLAVVGPIEVPSWPTPITAGNALQILQFEQYERYRSDEVFERIDFLGQVAQLAWGRLTSGNLPPLPQLLAALGPPVQQKHVFLWSSRLDEQRLFEDLGAAGKVAAPSDDFVGLVTQNAAGNKIDYFLRRELDYRVELDPATERLTASATVSLHNDAPGGGLSPGLIGNELTPALPNGTNKLYLSFYTPWELVGARVDGEPVALERGTELGRHVYSTAVVIPPRSTAVIELTLSGRRPDRATYRLDVHRQPVVAPDEVTTTLLLPPGWRTASGDQERRTSHRLESDATVTVPLRRR